jgi:L-malate glycosyltransferase
VPVGCVDQVIPTIVERDAVSTHTLEVQRVLQGMGLESEIFAQNIGVGLHRRVRPVASLDDGRPAERVLLYQASIGSPVGDVVAGHRAPKLLNYHNITPVELVGWWQPHLTEELVLGRAQLRRLAPLTRLGVAVSRYNEAELLACGFAATAVAPLLVDLGADAAADPGVLERLARERDSGGSSWLFVGQLAPHKCQHDVISALAFYRAAYDPSARLHLVGRETSPRYAQMLRRLTVELGLSGAVVMEGSVSEAALAALYSGTDVLVCCSEHEGFCAPLIEAMHHRLPIVAYGAAAVPETVAGAGVVLPDKRPSLVAAAVDRVLSDSALRERLVEAGVQRARDFDLDRGRAAFAGAVAGALEGDDRVIGHPDGGGALDGRRRGGVGAGAP